MSFLRSLFGPSRDEVWQSLARQVEGHFLEGGMFSGGSRVQSKVGDWILTLDTYTQSDGDSSTTYTRLRAPFVNPEGFHFTIYRASMFSGLGVALGMQDIEVGDLRFDRDFVVKANHAPRVRWLLESERLRELISAQPRFHVTVKDDEGWFGADFPDGVDELCFVTTGVIKDLAWLETLFTLFAELLHRLCHQGAAYEDDVDLHVARLVAPGGRVEGKDVLWDGDRPRREAAEALASLADPRALDALISTLDDGDDQLRLRVIDALARIAHQDAVRPLLPLLADPSRVEGTTIRQRAADALGNMGEGDLVATVLAALAGDPEGLRTCDEGHRAALLETFERALGTHDAAAAADALVELRAVESLPRLRWAERRHGRDTRPGTRIQAAIEILEARASLPRPADAGAEERDRLPRPAGEPGPDADSLPRPVEGERDD